MRQLLILSGKGGTGKTTIAGAFIKLAQAKAYADCDVDAPNLHLVMNQKSEPQRMEFYGMNKARIDPDRCTACGLCSLHCRFGAIGTEEGYCVDPFACEGCGVCSLVCPSSAASMQPAAAGELALYSGTGTVFSTARLKTGGGNSGKLVTEVKKQLSAAAPPESKLAVVDGSPGIGCPVIASLSGADMVLIVAEPSLSGISDMERIIGVARRFGIKTAVCVNKYDISRKYTETIRDYCRGNDICFAGLVPLDQKAVRAVNQGITVVDAECPSGLAVREVFDKVMACLES